MKVFLTKYVLSEKVIKEVEMVERYSGTFYYEGTGHAAWQGFKMDRDIFDNRYAAITDANERRAKKIASLQKQISKLEKMTFV